METTFTYHQDSGHGWLEVPMLEIVRLGMGNGHFSQFSYCVNSPERGNRMYLEEDCDAGIFIDAWVAQYKQKPAVVGTYLDGDHWIRDLSRNTPGAAYRAWHAERFGIGAVI